ncbi:hypothetical protein CUMW_059480 [Citrus unshiu]|nr:hypothetical protein CUMW_059480 [Citrus unshiu]
MSLENSLKLLYPLNPISRYSSLILLMNKMATNRFVSSQICSLVNLPHRSTDSDEFLLPDFPEASTIQVNQLAYYLRVADGSDSISTVLQKVLPERTNADGILVNTIEELDKIGLEAKLEPAKEHGISAELCKNWLDTKSCISVLYVSFGSQNKIAVSQKMQLAMALDASGKNFIWIVRPPIGFDINSEFKANEWLPRGFEERVKGQGLVVHKWAPQVEILSHKSISAFLSHCGWNLICARSFVSWGADNWVAIGSRAVL